MHDIREWANDFLVTRLGPTLLKLGCADRHWESITKWFRNHAPAWQASSQTEFDAVATTRLTAEVRRRVASDVGTNFDSLTKALRAGLRKTVPAKLRHKKIIESVPTQHIGRANEDDYVRRHVEKSGVDEDAQQDAFVRLLETGSSDSKSAHIAGMSSGRDASRSALKYVPVSQMELAKDEEGESLPPWERSIDRESRDFDEAVWKLLRGVFDDNRKALLLKFWDENSDDMVFLFSYLARKGYRKRPTSQKERDRAAGIIKRLRRLDKSD